MDCQDYITTEPGRKRGQHLGPTERGAIQELRKLGFSYRAIARKVNCAHGTVQNELKRGTPPRKSRKGRAPGYSAKRGQSVYKANRARCRKRHRIIRCSKFVAFVVEMVRKHRWSLDACAGYARLHNLFRETRWCVPKRSTMNWRQAICRSRSLKSPMF